MQKKKENKGLKRNVSFEGQQDAQGRALEKIDGRDSDRRRRHAR